MSADEIVLPPGVDTNSLVSEPDDFYNWLIFLFLLSLLINTLPWLAYWLVQFFRVNEDVMRIPSDASVEVEANQEPITSSSINQQELPDETVDVRDKTKRRTFKWTEAENTLKTLKGKKATSPISEKEQPKEVVDRGAKTEKRTYKWTESTLKNLKRKTKLKARNDPYKKPSQSSQTRDKRTNLKRIMPAPLKPPGRVAPIKKRTLVWPQTHKIIRSHDRGEFKGKRTVFRNTTKVAPSRDDKLGETTSAEKPNFSYTESKDSNFRGERRHDNAGQASFRLRRQARRGEGVMIPRERRRAFEPLRR